MSLEGSDELRDANVGDRFVLHYGGECVSVRIAHKSDIALHMVGVGEYSERRIMYFFKGEEFKNRMNLHISVSRFHRENSVSALSSILDVLRVY